MTAGDPTRLGTVESVSGATVSVALESTAASGLTYIGGEGYRAGQVGNFVRIRIGLLDLFGVISQIGAGAVPDSLAQDQPYGYRWMTVQLVGESAPGGSFERGLSEYPTIGDPVFLLTDRDLDRLYGEPDELRHVRIGRLAGGGTVAARVDLGRLVTRHAAIVGATGSGKSSTVARLLARVVDSNSYPGARAMLFDLHGEYAPALEADATVFSAAPRPGGDREHLWVPFWALPLSQLVELTMGRVEDRQLAAISEQVLAMKRETLSASTFRGVDPNTVTSDSPVPFSLKKLWHTLHRRENATHTAAQTGQSDETEALLKTPDGSGYVQVGSAENVIPAVYRPQEPGKVFLSGRGQQLRRQVDLLGQRLRDPRYAFLLRPGPFEPDLAGAIESDLDVLFADWLGGSKPIALLDLAAAPVSVIDPLIGAIVNIVYESLLWSRNLPEGGRERPLLMVFEEAHSYLGSTRQGFAGEEVRRVVREGRKYGVGALIVSQRPSELDGTVLSQCGTLFALRLSNSADRQQIAGAVSENFQGLLANLPILRTGEAIVLGEAVRMPMRTQVDALPRGRQPNSQDPEVIAPPPLPGGWTRPRPATSTATYDDVLAAWRSQDPRGVGDRELPKMDRTPVVSSSIAAVGYDPASQTLEIEFTSGGIYQYFEVAETVYSELIAAASVGSYFHAYVKNVYAYARL